MRVDVERLAEEIRSGRRRALARGITLVESSRPDHRGLATELLHLLTPVPGSSFRVGISGSPGVGKSTFIEALGNHLLSTGARLAVLAVDPSSSVSGGCIMGDKTRMETLCHHREVFIRPSPAGRTLGGVARRTRETMLLCEAAGFDRIVVETVGVGQSETAVADMTDMFMVLLSPGGGDDLQGIKRGIMELADLIVVTKADGELAAAARHAALDALSAVRLMHPRTRNWRVPVKTCSAREGAGIDEVWEIVESFRDTVRETGEFEQRRSAQSKSWLWSEISEGLIAAFQRHDPTRERTRDVEEAVIAGRRPPAAAAEELLESFLGYRIHE